MLSEEYSNKSWLEPKTAALYDWIDSYTADLAMWLKFAQFFPKPILELGCGTGRVLLHLARNEIIADGLDYSEYMLNRALWKIALENNPFANKIRLFHEDMTKFCLPQNYGFIFIACNSLNEVFSAKAQEQTIKHCAQALTTNGVLAISNSIKWQQYSQVASCLEEAERILHLSGISPVSNNPMKCYGQSFIDPKTGLINYLFEIEEEQSDGSIIKTRIPQTGFNRIRRIKPAELIQWCNNAGLCVFAEFGSFSLEPFDPQKHQRHILLARKP